MIALQISADEFRSVADRITSLVAEFLEDLNGAASFPACSGGEVTARFSEPIPEDGLRAHALDALVDIIATSRAPTPRFYGYVLGSGEPVAAVADMLASILNQNVTSWRSAPRF